MNENVDISQLLVQMLVVSLRIEQPTLCQPDKARVMSLKIIQPVLAKLVDTAQDNKVDHGLSAKGVGARVQVLLKQVQNYSAT